MSVIDDVQEIFGEFPQDEGYIVALRNTSFRAESAAKYRVLFLKKFKASLTADVVGGSIENAHLYPTWQEAAADAKSWEHSNKSTTRILHVRRRTPIELLDHTSINVLDALAEA